MADGNYWTDLRSRRMGRRKLIAGTGVLGAGVAAAALVGCGDDDDDGGASGQPTSAAQAQPKRGGNYAIIASTGEMPHHDVHQSTTGLLHLRGSGAAYARLIGRKLGPGVGVADIIPEAWVAQSWEQPDDTTFVFKLNPAAKWQNIAPVSGRQLVADDVVFSINRQIELKTVAAFVPGVPAGGVTATDPQTVRIRVQKPDADFLVALTAGQNKIIAREAVALKGDIKDGPVIGAGGWIFKEWVPNNTVRFVRNPDYWRKDQFGTQLPYADSFEILRIADPSTSNAAFRTKQVAVIGPTGGDPSKEDVDVIRRQFPDAQVAQEPATSAFGLTMRSDIAPTNDIRVRQAVSKAIDRAAIINTVLSGGGRLNLGLVSPNTEADLLPEEEVKRLLARDLAGARQLMQAAGVSNWTPEIWVYRLQAPNVPAAEFGQAQLKEIGINGNLQLMDNVKLTSWYTAQDLAFVFAPPTAFVFGPNAYLSQVLKTGGPRNVSKISDPELDRLIDAQAAELKDPARRRQLLHQTQRRIIELAAMTPMFTSLDFTVQHANVRGIYAGRTNEPRYYEEVWLDQ